MFPKALVALILAGAALAQDKFSVATPPSLTECQPVQIAWSGGKAPYIVWISAPGKPSERIAQLGEKLEGNTLTWTVNQQANTQFTINVSDSVGVQTGSAPVTVMAGTDKSCLGKEASVVAGGGGTPQTGGATNSATSTSQTGSATSAASGTSATSKGTATKSGPASASSTKAASSAMSQAAPVAAVVAAAGAVLLF